jgi:hypothetical protein
VITDEVVHPLAPDLCAGSLWDDEDGGEMTVKQAVAFGTLIGMISGAIYFFDARFAKCAEVKAIERRLDYKIEKDYLLGMRDQLYQLRQQHPTTASRTPVIEKEINDLETTIPMQRDKVKALEAPH